MAVEFEEEKGEENSRFSFRSYIKDGPYPNSQAVKYLIKKNFFSSKTEAVTFLYYLIVAIFLLSICLAIFALYEFRHRSDKVATQFIPITYIQEFTRII